jgi:fermentation-respiration switch protein FrsA (DUF1100 family)
VSIRNTLRGRLGVAACVVVAVVVVGPPVRGIASLTVAASRFSVGVHHETLVDTSRSTPPNGAAPGATDRRFPTTIWYPARGDPKRTPRAEAEPDRSHGPYPLVAFLHGFTETPSVYGGLLARWAAAGYIVAAPALPLSNGDAPGGPSQADVPAHPADVGFVLTQLLTDQTSPHDLLHGLLAPDRIAVAGHSMGGAIAYSLGFERCCRDPRVRAVLDFSQLPIPLRPDDDGPQAFEAETGVPVLLINGDHDEYFPPDVFNAGYTNASPPKYDITLVGATHKPPYQQPRDAHFPIVAATSIDFLNNTLDNHPDMARLAERLKRDAHSTRRLATFQAAT